MIVNHSMIGHNSVQIPHDGVQTDKTIGGAKFKAQTFFRPTLMSLAMEKAGILPGTHVVPELSAQGRIRDRNDYRNERTSAHIAF